MSTKYIARTVDSPDDIVKASQEIAAYMNRHHLPGWRYGPVCDRRIADQYDAQQRIVLELRQRVLDLEKQVDAGRPATDLGPLETIALISDLRDEIAGLSKELRFMRDQSVVMQEFFENQPQP